MGELFGELFFEDALFDELLFETEPLLALVALLSLLEPVLLILPRVVLVLLGFVSVFVVVFGLFFSSSAPFFFIPWFVVILTFLVFPVFATLGVSALVPFDVTDGLFPFDLRRILLLFICVTVGLVPTKLSFPIFLREF